MWSVGTCRRRITVTTGTKHKTMPGQTAPTGAKLAGSKIRAGQLQKMKPKHQSDRSVLVLEQEIEVAL